MTEQELHRAVFQYLSLTNPCVWYPVPNATGNLGPKLGAQLRNLGQRRSGVPDFAFHWKGGSGFIELKVGKNGLNTAQRAFRNECRELGIPHAVCRSIDAVIGTLRGWGVVRVPE